MKDTSMTLSFIFILIKVPVYYKIKNQVKIIHQNLLSFSSFGLLPQISPQRVDIEQLNNYFIFRNGCLIKNQLKSRSK